MTSTKAADAVAGGAGRLALSIPALAGAALLALALLDRARSRLRAGDREAGVGVVEWVLLIAVVVTIVAAVAVVVRQKVTAKANELDLGTP